MDKLKKYLLSIKSSIRDAIYTIEKGSAQIAIIVDSERKLLGLVTDGDVRRAILRGISIDETVDKIMTIKPLCLPFGKSRNEAISLMREKKFRHIPVVDTDLKIVDLYLLDELFSVSDFSNPIVIMAGGRGERLGQLTNNCPKPMVEINGKPLLEIILERCIAAGFKNFYFSVNYLKSKIIDYFGSGSNWHVKINYLEESCPLGTAGSLSLLPENIKEDIIVMNGDVLTRLDLDKLIYYHNKSGNYFTICTREYKTSIPFAVVESDDKRLKRITEKPTFKYQVNAGVYAMSYLSLKSIPKKFYNMTDLIDDVMKKNLNIGVFPIHEMWSDIGNPVDLEKARNEKY